MLPAPRKPIGALREAAGAEGCVIVHGVLATSRASGASPDPLGRRRPRASAGRPRRGRPRRAPSARGGAPAGRASGRREAPRPTRRRGRSARSLAVELRVALRQRDRRALADRRERLLAPAAREHQRPRERGELHARPGAAIAQDVADGVHRREARLAAARRRARSLRRARPPPRRSRRQLLRRARARRALRAGRPCPTPPRATRRAPSRAPRPRRSRRRRRGASTATGASVRRAVRVRLGQARARR